MVANLIKWPSWTGPSAGTPAAKKFQVKLTEMGIDGFADGDGTEKIMVIEIKWKGGPKTGRGPFHRPLTKQIKHVSGEAIVRRNEPIKWVDGFENVCNFPIISKENNVIGPFNVSFNFLYGTKTEAKAKMAVAGKVSVNLGEMATKTEDTVASKIPVILNVAGVTREATFSVCMTFVEVRSFPGSPRHVQTSTESTQPETTMEDAPQDKKGKQKQKQKQKSMEEVCLIESDMSVVIDLEGTDENGSNATTRRGTESCSVSGSETQQADSVKKTGIFSWKRRRLSFKPVKTKSEPSINKTANGDTSGVDQQKGSNPSSPVDSVASHLQQKPQTSKESGESEEVNTEGQWEEKELKSRDGKATLKASVFFASFHQCSDKAAGESACTALVAVIAHWLLQSNPASIPARSEFDRLIMQGSSEWRRLCDDDSLINHFPDKHFDLETVMRSQVRPISVRHESSFIGFFGPEKFESLRGAMSFDQIWDEIERGPHGCRPRVYIVSWNDHFFVLKVDPDAYYIIDTLGERLYEGCNRAYVIRFDDSSLMTHAKVKGSKEDESEGDEISKGKECCREFIKRFLAAIPLGELEMQEKKEPVSYFDLHHRLQIEFNFTSLSSSSSSSSSSSTSSPTNSISSDFSSESVDY